MKVVLDHFQNEDKNYSGVDAIYNSEQSRTDERHSLSLGRVQGSSKQRSSRDETAETEVEPRLPKNRARGNSSVDDQSMVPIRIVVGHVDKDESILHLGSLPGIPHSLEVNELLELNALQIEMTEHLDRRFEAQETLTGERSNSRRCIVREARAHLSFRRKLLEFRKMREDDVGLRRRVSMESPQDEDDGQVIFAIFSSNDIAQPPPVPSLIPLRYGSFHPIKSEFTEGSPAESAKAAARQRGALLQ